MTMNFPAGENVFVTVSLSAKDDDIVESLENFTLHIDIEHDAFHHGVVQLENGMIFLEDDDCECSSNTLFFTEHTHDPINLYRLECEHIECL